MSWRSSARAVGLLSGGTLLGQAFGVGVAPLLTRLYSPLEFGLGAAAASVVAILASISCCSADQMIHSTGLSEERARFARAGLLSNRVLAAATLLTGFVVLDRTIDNLLLVISVAIASYMAGLYMLGTQVALVAGQFRRIARRDAIQGASQAISQVLLGLAQPKASSLTAGQALSRSLAFFQVRPELKLLLATAPGTVWREARDTRWRPLFLATGGVALTSVSLQAPVVLASAWFGRESAGFVALSQRVLALPLAIVGTSIGQTLLHRMNVLRQTPYRTSFVTAKKYATVLGAGGLILAIAVAALAPWAFTLFFGESWTEAGEVARASSLAIGSQFVSSPLSVVLIPLGLARVLATVIAVRLCLAIAVFGAVSLYGGSIVMAILVYGCVQVIVNVALVVVALKALNRVI